MLLESPQPLVTEATPIPTATPSVAVSVATTAAVDNPLRAVRQRSHTLMSSTRVQSKIVCVCGTESI